MGTVNPVNRELLLNAAKNLFYEKGYKNTTFLELADTVGVHKTLITYYFKSKVNLASLVIRGYIIDYTRLIDEVLVKITGEADPLYSSALRTFVIFHGFDENPHLKRFFLEFSEDSKPPIYDELKRSTIINLRKKFSLPFDDKKLRFIQMVDDSSRESLIISFFSGQTDLTLDEAIELKVKLLYQMFNLPTEYVERIYSESKEIYERAAFSYGPGFTVQSGK